LRRPTDTQARPACSIAFVNSYAPSSDFGAEPVRDDTDEAAFDASASWHFAARQLDCRSGNSVCKSGQAAAVDCIDASAQVAELD
jgi:hypothetical protein